MLSKRPHIIPRDAFRVRIILQQALHRFRQIAEIRRHLDRYKELVGQGKWSEAGKELEAIQAIVSK